MPHPPYSPDLAPSDYHLFRLFQNHFNGKIFDSNEAVKSGIMKLTERWQRVIGQNGQYIID